VPLTLCIADRRKKKRKGGSRSHGCSTRKKTALTRNAIKKKTKRDADVPLSVHPDKKETYSRARSLGSPTKNHKKGGGCKRAATFPQGGGGKKGGEASYTMPPPQFTRKREKFPRQKIRPKPGKERGKGGKNRPINTTRQGRKGERGDRTLSFSSLNREKKRKEGEGFLLFFRRFPEKKGGKDVNVPLISASRRGKKKGPAQNSRCQATRKERKKKKTSNQLKRVSGTKGKEKGKKTT